VLALVGGLVYWALDYLNVAEPFNRFAKMAMVVVAVLIIILLLLQFTGVHVGLPSVT
jgi:uncharacterized protein YhhL (DUF1145 family)